MKLFKVSFTHQEIEVVEFDLEKSREAYGGKTAVTIFQEVRDEALKCYTHRWLERNLEGEIHVLVSTEDTPSYPIDKVEVQDYDTPTEGWFSTLERAESALQFCSIGFTHGQAAEKARVMSILGF